MQNDKDSYNRGGFIAFLFSTIFSLLFFVYVALIYPGIDLKEIPKEARAGDDGGHIVADQTGAKSDKAADVSSIDKPWEPNDAMVAYGKSVYQMQCAACHGPGGGGDGPAASGLIPPPRNLVAGPWKKGGDSISLFNTLTKGIPGGSMGAFSHLSTKDRWSLVQFIRSITEDKVADDSQQLEEFAQSAK